MLSLRKDIKSKEVSSKNFEEALDKVPPSATPEVEKTYEELGKQFSSAKGKQMKEEMPNYFG
jgi:SpoVK/Ycf46/Vps4 family AAA+-type ATPase